VEPCTGAQRGDPRDHGSGHLLEIPIVRPWLISPLSMRTLKPQSGLLHTHAL
jgi:hypothetical protein